MIVQALATLTTTVPPDDAADYCHELPLALALTVGSLLAAIGSWIAEPRLPEIFEAWTGRDDDERTNWIRTQPLMRKVVFKGLVWIFPIGGIAALVRAIAAC